MWDLPRPGLEPASPALAGRFSTTAPQGKPGSPILKVITQAIKIKVIGATPWFLLLHTKWCKNFCVNATALTQFPIATVTNYHKQWLKITKLFSYTSGGQKSKLNVMELKSTCPQDWFIWSLQGRIHFLVFFPFFLSFFLPSFLPSFLSLSLSFFLGV